MMTPATARIPVTPETQNELRDTMDKGTTYDEFLQDLLREHKSRDVHPSPEARKALDDLKSVLNWNEEKIIEWAVRDMRVNYHPDLSHGEATKPLEEKEELLNLR